ncbi:hypothetical protein EDB83DRAFT_1565688 [Lactarius deliciosus]|nr:hypothetical protein EDB83DRAFT_1565688 [Lactarius deliciosus]
MAPKKAAGEFEWREGQRQDSNKGGQSRPAPLTPTPIATVCYLVAWNLLLSMPVITPSKPKALRRSQHPHIHDCLYAPPAVLHGHVGRLRRRHPSTFWTISGWHTSNKQTYLPGDEKSICAQPGTGVPAYSTPGNSEASDAESKRNEGPGKCTYRTKSTRGNAGAMVVTRITTRGVFDVRPVCPRKGGNPATRCRLRQPSSEATRANARINRSVEHCEPATPSFLIWEFRGSPRH